MGNAILINLNLVPRARVVPRITDREDHGLWVRDSINLKQKYYLVGADRSAIKALTALSLN